MATIHPFGAHEALEPEAVAILVSAYESALDALAASEPELVTSDSTRQALAEYIMTMGLVGERDPIRLSEGALARLRERSEG